MLLGLTFAKNDSPQMSIYFLLIVMKDRLKSIGGSEFQRIGQNNAVIHVIQYIYLYKGCMEYNTRVQ